MPRPGSIIPKAPITKLMIKAGAKRVSDAAAEQLVNYLLDYANEISERAIKIAKHSGRKTIKASDINLAVK